MIGKASTGGGAAGVLDYCYFDKDKQKKEPRGEILFCQNLTLSKLPNGIFDMKHLAKQFEEVANLNTRMKKYIWHQSFSFPIDEKPDEEQIQEIVLEFSKEFGFEDNQLIVFRHADTAHEHFHIVANRLNKDGINTANQYDNYRRIGQFCRKMEKKLGLKSTLGMISDPKQKRKEAVNTNPKAAQIRTKIDAILPKVNSINELIEQLKKEKIEAEIGRGIVFTYQNERFKGSDLGREYSLMNLTKQLSMKPLPVDDLTKETNQTDKSETKREETNSPINLAENGLAGRRPNFKNEDDEKEKKRLLALKQFKR
jgi:Relaxase/Mobilisation nuclease domain